MYLSTEAFFVQLHPLWRMDQNIIDTLTVYSCFYITVFILYTHGIDATQSAGLHTDPKRRKHLGGMYLFLTINVHS